VSYNCSTFKLKRLENFRIPLAALVGIDPDMQRRGWTAEVQVPNGAMFDRLLAAGIAPLAIEPREDGRVHVEVGGESVEFWGTLDGDVLAVDAVDVNGEGSGTIWHDHLLGALEESTGTLEAVMIWEGGDSISRVLVVDGEVTEGQYEL
jgi:hypothetical protein